MGLKHQAIHAMLANPTVASFEVIDEPKDLRDWILIDHLMMIHKVKADDYVEGEHAISVLNMVNRLVCHYIKEKERGRFIVLVKDGRGVQKPSVRELRSARVIAPHIQFCRSNLDQIEYGVMKLLADMGMKENVFMVTGAEWSETVVYHEESPLNDAQAMVSFHQEYLEYNMLEEERSLLDVSSETDPSYFDGKILRPRGISGVFVATFADPAGGHVTELREGCKKCKNSEADTLLVELANVLEGEITVCTGDSDLVAVLTASGRKDLVLRLDNRSYRSDRVMHDSLFGELLTSPNLKKEQDLILFQLTHSNSPTERFQILCDLDVGDERMLTEELKKHEDLERVLRENGGVSSMQEVLQYLYRGGIRGSVYVAFLNGFSESGEKNKVEELVRKVREFKGRTDTKAVGYLFETLCIAAANASEGGDSIPVGEKRKRSYTSEDYNATLNECDTEHCEKGELSEKRAGGAKELTTSGLKRMVKAYMNHTVPQGSHSRYLRLSRCGLYLFLRVKPRVLLDDRVRLKMVMFMALCGTDYSVTPIGLGIKRLLNGAIKNQRTFSSWCEQLSRSMWPTACDKHLNSYCSFYDLGIQLADLTGIPLRNRSTHWTNAKCELMFKTLKYVCDLWCLRRPRIGPEYGLFIQDGVARFQEDGEQHNAILP